MAAERNTAPRGSVDGGFAVHVDKDEIEALELSKPVALPRSTVASGAADSRTAATKAAPTSRGGDRGRGMGRGPGAPQARRYAFRRS